MRLSLQNFSALVQSQAAAAQARCRALADLRSGSVLRSLLEANASVALWLQWLVLLVLKAGRLQTSEGADVDSWVADFGLARLPATPAVGQVVISRYSAGSAATVPVGALVRTADLSQSYSVVADSSNPAFRAGASPEEGGGYVLPAGQLSVLVPVRSVVPGAAGNVLAGSVSLLGSAIPGVDLVNNPAAFSGGEDAESDDALKARFPNYVAGLSKATRGAVESAIEGVQQGLSYSVSVNVDEGGRPKPGHFVITLDDGSGSPSDALKSSVYAAVDQVRALTETFSVQPPALLTANVSLVITAAPGFAKANLIGPVSRAVSDYVDGLGIGEDLPLTRISAVAYGVAGVRTVSAVRVNGAADDLAPGPLGTVRAGVVVVS